jgi:hypothetical protein
MFIRKKKNPSGIVSIRVIDKSKGKYRVLRTVGSSSDAAEIDILYRQGKRRIDQQTGLRDMFTERKRGEEERQVVRHLLSNVENILLNGTQLISDQVLKQIGFDAIDDEIPKHSVIARISQPLSKLGTVDYLKSYFDEDMELHGIYRYSDKLYNTQREKIQQIGVNIHVNSRKKQ